jgi:GNAT superfamily N-acetyltransferase
MIEYRCFRNDDPPRLADIWRGADLGPRAVQPMTASLLEGYVFSKPYFDRAGLIIACDDGRPVGFAHAAFGPDATRMALDTAAGTTLVVVVVPHAERAAIAAGLLARCEDYLRRRGATTICGGGRANAAGFYLGLYGGSDVPGILDTAPAMQAVFERAGYAVADRIAVLRRALGRFRPPVNRLQVAIQRATRLSVVDEPPRRSWWEAAVTSGIALRRYVLANLAGETLGTATFFVPSFT